MTEIRATLPRANSCICIFIGRVALNNGVIEPNTGPSASPCVCTTVRRADRALTRIYDEALQPSGLLTTQYALLSTLARVGEPMLHSALAEAQMMSPATLSRNLKPLQRDGLVRIAPGTDRRTRYVELTGAGHEALERARPLWRAVQAQVRETAGAERIETLLAELQSLVVDLRRHEMELADAS
jgi:DNA-binding MarR family transcriptional regulator